MVSTVGDVGLQILDLMEGDHQVPEPGRGKMRPHLRKCNSILLHSWFNQKKFGHQNWAKCYGQNTVKEEVNLEHQIVIIKEA